MDAEAWDQYAAKRVAERAHWRGLYLDEFIRVELRLDGVIWRALRIAQGGGPLFYDQLLERLRLGEKIETVKAILALEQLRDSFPGLAEDLKAANTLRNRFAHLEANMFLAAADEDFDEDTLVFLWFRKYRPPESLTRTGFDRALAKVSELRDRLDDLNEELSVRRETVLGDLA